MSLAEAGLRKESTEMFIRDKVLSENVLLPGILIIHKEPAVKDKKDINIKRQGQGVDDM